MSKLDPNQIVKKEHDEETGSKKVKIVSTEMSIELNADDGDSVQTQARCISIELSENEEYDISAYSKATLYCKKESESMTTVTLDISPQEDGDFYMDSGMSLALDGPVGSSYASNEKMVQIT